MDHLTWTQNILWMTRIQLQYVEINYCKIILEGQVTFKYWKNLTTYILKILFKVECYTKGSVPLRRSENIRKIENEYFVHCLVSWCSLMFKLLSEKMPVFKIEYLSSYNRFFRVGVLCLHWNPIENKPRPNIQSP